ncbi:MAG: hypothetical protein ACK4OO_05210, partial [bacterium]
MSVKPLSIRETEKSSESITVEEKFESKEWEDFVEKAVNGTLYHTLRFLSYHPQGRFQHHHIVFRRKGNLIGIFPGAVREENGEKFWISHPGASYGGPAWLPKLKYHHLEEMIANLVSYAESKGFSAIRITLPPVIYNPYPEQAIDFALWRNGFHIV